MMLSVLIPTRDYNCYRLAYQIQQQLAVLPYDYEVIIAEDGSRDQVSLIGNHLIIEQPHCRHIRLRENIGRAAIRNYLASEAKGDFLLFVDSDAKVVSRDFIQRYMEALSDRPDVIVGGLCNPDQLPDEGVTLRYLYEKSTEYQRTVEYRTQHAYEHFATFNFLVSRETFREIPFNESCTQYGYEDALMGKDLQRRGKRIKHIDNPLMHLGFESNVIFLTKTETALRTLHSLGELMVPYTRVGKMAGKIASYHATWLVKGLFPIIRPLLRANLLGDKPNMTLFAIYKLGYFISI